jgi:Xaa-Pro aminopeptidase
MSTIPRSGTVAVGDRIWGEALLNLGHAVGFERLATGSHLVNDLRRVKDDDELTAMGRAIAAAEQTMTAVRELVQPGVSMGELAEAVDSELRGAGSRCPSFTTHIFTNFGPGELDSGTETARTPIPEGTSVMFDFGGVVDGYCSDFGRTVYCGEPPREVRDVYEVMLAAHAAGLSAAAAGVPAFEVNAACRRPIEEAGLGEHFRHRMGHGIGMDVHERPFISTEDETPLQVGMTFTDEPSIIIPGRFSVRIEDIVVCEEDGGRTLNGYPAALVANN